MKMNTSSEEGQVESIYEIKRSISNKENNEGNIDWEP